MKLFRFMSLEEFQKYQNGETLTNNKDHYIEGERATNSVGFCFFNYAQYKPEEMLHSVFGIVSIAICAIFETDRKNVRKTKGRYSRPKAKDSFERETYIATEYCTTQYSKNNFKLLKYAIPDWFNWNEWQWKENE